jgi:hypothetical protein
MDDEETAADRLELALDLHDAGVEMMRATLKRRMPTATDDEIEDALSAWLAKRPGADDGDGVGTPRPWPRSPR